MVPDLHIYLLGYLKIISLVLYHPELALCLSFHSQCFFFSIMMGIYDRMLECAGEYRQADPSWSVFDIEVFCS